MPNFKITHRDNTTEIIDASRYEDNDGYWIDFVDANGFQILRVVAQNVARVERA